MIKKIKNLFLNFLKLNKKSVAFLLFFIALGFLVPVYLAHASWLARAIAIKVMTKIIGKFFLAATVISLILTIGPAILLSVVTSPFFLRIDFATDDFILMGWEITRNLANMFFILFLIVIAMATMLRIGDYQAKKSLPILIIIILLINFTPVFADIIIDSSDIFMRFFLGYGTGLDSVLMPIEVLIGSVRVAVERGDFDFRGAAEGTIGILLFVITFPIFIVIFSLIMGVVFLILSFIFIIRPIALIMLIILSPIAFLCYVFPSTKKIWDQWWNQFIQWCLVGVVAAFFLYLIDRLSYILAFQGIGGVGGEKPCLAEIQAAPGGIFLVFLPSMVILGFMLMALFATFSISAGGASHAIGFGKKAGNWVGNAMAVKAGTIAARKYPEIAHRIAGRAEKISEKLRPTEGATGLKAGFRSLMARPAEFVAQQAENFAQHGEEEILTREKKHEARYDRGTKEERIMGIKFGDKEQRIAALRSMGSNFETEDAEKAIGKGGIAKIHELAKKQNLHKPIETSYLHLHDKFGMTSEEKDKATKRIIQKPELIKHISSGAYNKNSYEGESRDEDFDRTQEMVKKFRPKHLSEAARGSDESRESVQSIIQKEIDEKGFKKFAEDNNPAAKWMCGQAGRESGFVIDTGMSEKDENQAIRAGSRRQEPGTGEEQAATGEDTPSAPPTSPSSLLPPKEQKEYEELKAKGQREKGRTREEQKKYMALDLKLRSLEKEAGQTGEGKTATGGGTSGARAHSPSSLPSEEQKEYENLINKKLDETLILRSLDNLLNDAAKQRARISELQTRKTEADDAAANERKDMLGTTLKRIDSIEQKIQKDKSLSKKWEEIESLREKEQKQKGTP